MTDIFTELFIATFILCIWSLLYRENPAYRLVQHIFIGAQFGFSLYMGLKVLYDKTLIPLMTTGDIYLLTVTILGILIWCRLIPSLEWLSRLSFGLLAGIGMSIGIRGALYAQIIKQTEIGSFFISGDPLTSINNIITGVFAFSAIVFFIYTRKQKGVQGVISRIGRIGLMLCFGAIMGTFLMGNTAFSIGLIPDLVSGTGLYVSVVVIIVILIDAFYLRPKTEAAKISQKLQEP